MEQDTLCGYTRTSAFAALNSMLERPPVDDLEDALLVQHKDALFLSINGESDGPCLTHALALMPDSYHHIHLRVVSPEGLAGLRAALGNKALAGKVERIVSFTMVANGNLPSTARDLSWVLHALTHIIHVFLHIPQLPEEQVSFRRIYPLQSLNTDSAFLHSLRGPFPQLSCLSVHVADEDERTIYTTISRLFGSTLVKLRILRHHDTTHPIPSPARICAALTTKRLEYLEVRDVATTDDAGLGILDMLHDTELAMAAAAGTPELKILLWTPPWYHCAQSASPLDGCRTAVTYYESDLHAVLGPLKLYIRVSRTLATFSWSDVEGRQFGGAKNMRIPTEEMWRI